jgi:hypothetical protein
MHKERSDDSSSQQGPNSPRKHSDGSPGVLFGRKDDCAESAGAAVWAEGDVCADDGAGLAEEVLQVLPLDVERELPAVSVR